MTNKQSPDFVKLSQASGISLSLLRGRMYRGAVNRCVNLLVHYPEGCSANCAYCGLAKKRPGTYKDKSFIHVDWPIFSMHEIVAAINNAPPYVKRTCISMITNGKCRAATLKMTRTLKEETSLPVSILVSPTIVDRDDITAMKGNGADKIGIAIDLATPELFDRYRGKQVSGPHRWEHYWEVLNTSLEIFGDRNVGVHLMVGMDESEQQMVSIMDKILSMGAVNHLFSFFAENGSRLADRPSPPWPTYLRVQLARYVLENDLSRYKDMAFDQNGHIIDFGISSNQLREAIDLGTPFMTTGCLGPDGEVACNRPFGNCLPDVKQWNYPYPPNQEEMDLIRQEILKNE